MKILDSSQIRWLDQASIKEQGIRPIDLMEQATSKLFEWFKTFYPPESYPPKSNSPGTQSIAVVCGPGNNGGDGLALTRMLSQAGYTVQAYLIIGDKSLSPECKINFERIPHLVKSVQRAGQLPSLKPYAIIIDALFGNGLSRPLAGVFATAVGLVNQSLAKVIAIDIASGLFADQPTSHDAVIKPDITLSFQLPKLAFLAVENAVYTGDWQVLDIGLSRSFIQKTKSPYVWLDATELPQLKTRQKYAHKGNFGHLLTLNGSVGKLGAAVLAAKAALRGGVGKLTSHLPTTGVHVLQTALPEAMCSPDPHEHHLTQYPVLKEFNAVIAGSGLGQAAATIKMLKKLFQACKIPMVLDADAINSLTTATTLPPNTVLTPHPKEFKRWLGDSKNSFERWQKQLDYSTQYQVYIILKGCYSSVSSGSGQLYFNSSGTPALATAGSGDVLAGLLGALLAQGYSAQDTALLGTYWHGLAGELAAKQQMSLVSVIASDVIKQFGPAYQQIESAQLKIKSTS